MSEQTELLARWLWVDQVASDPCLPPNATRVAIAIAAHVNGKTGLAWPSVEHVAELLGLNHRSVRRCITALVGAGHLSAKVGGGKVSSQYRLLRSEGHVEISRRKSCSNRDAPPLTELSGVGGVTPVSSVMGPGTELSGDPCQQRQGTPVSSVMGPLSVAPYELTDKNSLNEPTERTRSLAREAAIIPFDPSEERFCPTTRKRRGQLPMPIEGGEGKPDPDGWPEYWFTYPKKVGELKAREAYREARKHASAEEILEGARRERDRAASDRRDPAIVETYIKDPANWLKEQRWRDKIKAPRPAGVGRHTAQALEEMGVDFV